MTNKQKNKTITTFTQLDAWKKAHELVLNIYELVKDFPQDEIYGLASQMKRCAISISSNIAEGFSRRTAQEKKQFYYISKSSLTELQNQLLIARDVHYLKKEAFHEIASLSVEVHKMIHGLIKSAQTK